VSASIAASSMGASGSIPWLAGLRQHRALLVHRQRHGIAAKALLRDEALGGVDQFLQVLDAVRRLPSRR
jgi:hypothetical protein